MQDLNSPPGIEPVPLHCKHRVLATVLFLILKIIFFKKTFLANIELFDVQALASDSSPNS